MGITNIKLTQLAKKHHIPNFTVCMNDELDDYEYPKNAYFILNLKDSDQLGTHWTCLLIRNSIPCYFDSYGACYSEQVESYIKANYKGKIAFSAKIIQSFESQNCGLYCLGCIIYDYINSDKGLLENVNDYTNLFHSNPKLLKNI